MAIVVSVRVSCSGCGRCRVVDLRPGLNCLKCSKCGHVGEMVAPLPVGVVNELAKALQVVESLMARFPGDNTADGFAVARTARWASMNLCQ